MPNRRMLLAGTVAWATTAASGMVLAAVSAQSAGWRLTSAEWRKRLSPAQFAVLRQAGTETPFTSRLDGEHRRGVYDCAGCGSPLFRSDAKFDSGTGWPSFWQPMPRAVLQRPDRSAGMVRTEVLCRTCGGHLGHVFADGPRPTGLRYCINGVALTFRPDA